jgi:hypothetical protein
MFSFRKFWLYCWGTIVKPASTLKQLEKEASLSYAFAAYFLFGLLYGLFSLVVYFSGHLPRGVLVNFIPARTYYLWEGIFMIPVTMQIYILFAALSHLLSKLLNGQGSFEGTLSVLGFTYSIPLIVLFWVPDVVLFFLFGSQVQLNFVPFYGTAAGLWTIILSLMGIRITQHISFPRALFVTIVAMGFSFAFLGGLLIR